MLLRLGLAAMAAVLVAAAVLARAGNNLEATYASQEHPFQLEVVTDGLAHPWSLAFLPDGRALITERSGRLSLVDLTSGQRTRVQGVPEIRSGGQGGLLDVAVHPRFADNGWVYLSYVGSLGEGSGTHVGRGRLSGSALSDFEPLFRAEPYGKKSKHFGSRLVFDQDGYLFIGLGDRGERERAQDLADHNGSLIRLHDDGRVPADNPFIGRPDARPEIYSYGHRNIQGMTLHPQSGRVWLVEHGPRGGDELNLPEPGRNYGWPLITYGREYHGPRIGPTEKDGLEQPLHHWTPSIAPSGMTVYSGEAFPRWRGDLFVGALALTHLNRLRIEDGRLVAEERLLDGLGLRIRDVRQGPDGYLYLLVDQAKAPLLRLRPAS